MVNSDRLWKSLMDMAKIGAAEKAAKENGLKLDYKEIWYLPPVHFSADCVKAVENATQEHIAAGCSVLMRAMVERANAL